MLTYLCIDSSCNSKQTEPVKCLNMVSEILCLCRRLQLTSGWGRHRESEVSHQWHHEEEEIWGRRICKILVLKLISIFILSLELLVNSVSLSRSTRVTRRLGCPSLTSVTPSWAVVFWDCPSPWPTLASYCLCEYLCSEWCGKWEGHVSAWLMNINDVPELSANPNPSCERHWLY